jgi:hypothetical protein
VKLQVITRSHDLKEELLDYELELVDLAIKPRRSHLRAIDELDRLEAAPKQRKKCPTKKRPFRDKKEADRILHYIMNDRKEAERTGQHYRFRQFRSYLCPCGNFHHSSKPELPWIGI